MKKLIIAIVIIICAAVVFVYFQPAPAAAPVQTVETVAADSTAGIDADLQSIDTGNFDTDFESVNKDINGL